jgi:hypothetical protein
VAALAWLVETGKPMHSPANSFAEYAPEPIRDQKKDVVWFALKMIARHSRSLVAGSNSKAIVAQVEAGPRPSPKSGFLTRRTHR